MKTNDINKQAEKIVSDMNNLLRDCGMPVGLKLSPHWNATVGCTFCQYGRSFHVWLPKIAAPVINKVVESFKRAGFVDVGFDTDPTNDQFVQIDALTA